MNIRGNLALAQITLLIFGILAFGWMIGSEVKIVSGLSASCKDGQTTAEDCSKDADGCDTQRTCTSGGWSSCAKKVPGCKNTAELITGGTGTFATFYGLYKSASGAPNPTSLSEGLTYAKDTSTTSGSGAAPAKDLFTGEKDGKYFVNGKVSSLADYNKATGNTAWHNWQGMGQGFLGNLAEGLWWSVWVSVLVQVIGPMAGLNSDQTSTVNAALVGGIMAGKLVYGIIQEGGGVWGGTMTAGMSNAAWAGIGAGVVVAAIIFYSMWKDESTETVSFTCEQWQAPTGGNMCEQCNKQGILPCSEYQCRSLGQSCQLINKGTTDEKCTWINRQDVTPPVISLWKDVLTKDHRYAPDNRVSPPDTGTKIIYSQSSDGCIKAFTPLEFGVLTNEPASCKLDYQQKSSFDNMTYYFGGTSAFLYNHSQIMSLPGGNSSAQENITLKNNGEYSIFIRCSDSNGNKNVANFVLRFCVDKGPDTTPPLIVTTNLLNNMPVAYNQSKLDLEVYTNEPATCKWSHLNQAYEKMEQKMTCSSSVLEMNAQMLYRCKTQLNGIKNEIENDFYIRCEDQPLAQESSRNRNKESYKFTVIGTKPLVINYVEPNGTIMDSTETVKVTLGAKTLGGYQEGNSTCYYSTTEDDTDSIMFFNTNSYIHSQDLWLPEGTYTYYIKCVDLGGNSDMNKTSFKVKTDTESPIVVRAYNEDSNLVIVTNEPSECVYGINDCVYEVKDGIGMSSIDDNKTQHYTSWDTSKTFYVKCQDKYGTAPYPNQCSIILRPSEQMTVQN